MYKLVARSNSLNDCHASIENRSSMTTAVSGYGSHSNIKCNVINHVTPVELSLPPPPPRTPFYWCFPLKRNVYFGTNRTHFILIVDTTVPGMIARLLMAGANTTSLTGIDVPSRARLSLMLFLTLLFHLLCSTEAPGKHLRRTIELHTVVYPNLHRQNQNVKHWFR